MHGIEKSGAGRWRSIRTPLLPFPPKSRLAFQMIMKVILRSLSTDLYFLGPNMWTNDPERALDCGHASRAVKLARQAKLQQMELIFSFSGVRNGLRLPL